MKKFFVESLKVTIVAFITIMGIVYFLETPENPSVKTNIITVPAGQRVDLRLSDGSLVSLNAKSTIEYPATFSTDTREVRIEGEAYFDVAHNSKTPFVVHTQEFDIEVLGTKFNVEAYPNSDKFYTSLLEGAVKVTRKDGKGQSVKLIPNQEVYLKEGQLVKASITEHDQFRWKEGLISFRNIHFKDLMKRLEKYYDVRIVVSNNTLDNYVCSGKLRIADGLDNALNILQKDAKYSYTKSNDKATIYIK